MIAAEEQRSVSEKILCNCSSICSFNSNQTSNQSDITEDKTDKVIFIFIQFHGLSLHQYCDCDFNKTILNPDFYSSEKFGP